MTSTPALSAGDRFCAALRAWRAELGRTPTSTEAQKPGAKATHREARRLYGGWDQGCDAAEVPRPTSARKRPSFCGI